MILGIMLKIYRFLELAYEIYTYLKYLLGDGLIFMLFKIFSPTSRLIQDPSGEWVANVSTV